MNPASTFRQLATLVAVTLALPRVGPAATIPQDGTLVYFGTYTGEGPGKSKGIYFSRFDVAKGDATDPVLAVETESPSYLVLHPNHRFVYSTNEHGPNGGVSAFAIDPATSKLTFLNKVNSGGQGPCYLGFDKTGRYLMVANFLAGNATVLQVNEDGSLGRQTALVQHSGSGINPEWQKGPRAHWVGFSPDNRFALVANLGNDQVFVYRFDATTGSLTLNQGATVKMKPGYGPRNINFHPNGKFVYLLNQLSGALIVFRWNAGQGTLTQIQETSAVPPGFTEEFNSAKVLVEPNGKFLYTSTRGSDTMAVFAVDPALGTLTFIQQESSHGMSPRDFSLDPTGSYLVVANQYNDCVNFLGINRETGKLRRTRRVLKIDSVSSVLFVTPN